MACRGVVFAITDQETEKLRSFTEDEDRLNYLQEEIEERYSAEEPQRKEETDKAWDAIHRCLTDGTLGYENGTFPLSHVILGGESLYEGDVYIMVIKSPEQVKEIARSMTSVTEAFFRERYFKIAPKDYGMPLSEQDYQYTWEYFSGLVPFYQTAA